MKNDLFPKPEEAIVLDILHRGSVQLSKRFNSQMSREEAQANLNARALIFNISNRIFQRYGAGITREEVEGAIVIERNIPKESTAPDC
jgi:hypothetical protein